MKRTHISLEDIAEHSNLVLACYKAATGKRYRLDVQSFLQEFDVNLQRLAVDIRSARLPYGLFRAFRIADPKPRLIHAACFADRVFHHALMNLAGGVLDKAMLPCSYACRTGKGVHKAVLAVQQHLRQHGYYVKIDISGYFASIEHQRLLQVLYRRFKGAACHAQFARVLESYQVAQFVEANGVARGLPIGSLTSQYFANYYLDGLDRLLADHPLVKGQVRYMDDVIWFCANRSDCIATLQQVKDWLVIQRGLQIKPTLQIHASRLSVSYCGFRILPGQIRLSRRRKRRFQQRRLYWEQLYRCGVIDSRQLQQAYAAVQAITIGTDCRNWLREILRRHPSIAV